jgi:hypothetical protein
MMNAIIPMWHCCTPIKTTEQRLIEQIGSSDTSVHRKFIFIGFIDFQWENMMTEFFLCCVRDRMRSSYLLYTFNFILKLTVVLFLRLTL